MTTEHQVRGDCTGADWKEAKVAYFSGASVSELYREIVQCDEDAENLRRRGDAGGVAFVEAYSAALTALWRKRFWRK
jgi:hypothetical protein